MSSSGTPLKNRGIRSSGGAATESSESRSMNTTCHGRFAALLGDRDATPCISGSPQELPLSPDMLVEQTALEHGGIELQQFLVGDKRKTI